MVVTTSSIEIDGQAAPWLHIDCTGLRRLPALHFFPANGIPAASYLEFFSLLAKHTSISAMDARGTWRPQRAPSRTFNWLSHANDLIQAIEANYSQPIIGMGHSIGGTVFLLAARQRPDLFSRLVIIDAATLPSRAFAKVYNHLPEAASLALFAWIKKTKQRKQIWPDQATFYQHYRHHPTYRHLSETSFCHFVDAALEKQDNGQFKLQFDPQWEAFNFRRIHYLWEPLQNIQTPVLLLRAEHTYMYSQHQFDKKNRTLPALVTPGVLPDCHHLAPLENPRTVADTALQWLLKEYPDDKAN